MDKIDVNFLTDDSDQITAEVSVRDHALLSHKATFKLDAHVEVLDSSPVDYKGTVFRKELLLDAANFRFQIPKQQLEAYTYAGENIIVHLHSVIRVDNGYFIDTEVREKQQIKLGLRPTPSGNTDELMAPKDYFNFFKNLQAIPAHNQLLTLLIVIGGAILALINAAIGFHDQLSPDSQTWLYSHVDSDGESQSPLLNSLFGSGGIGALVWWLMRRELRKYMRFRLLSLPAAIQPGQSFALAEIIAGRSRVAIENAVIRIVACNMECGQYVRGSGTNRRTVSFRKPVRAVILFEKSIPKINANVPLKAYLQDNFSFDAVFKNLYPRQMFSSSHGVDIRWEVQLLHDTYVDQELVGPETIFPYQKFFKKKEASFLDEQL